LRGASSEVLLRVTLVRTDVSEELSASIIRVTRIDELGTLAVTSNALVASSYETSVLTRATRRNILEDAILHSHRPENLKSYTYILVFIAVSFPLTFLPITYSRSHFPHSRYMPYPHPPRLDNKNIVIKKRVCPSSPQHGASSDCGWKGLPSVVEVICEYIE
jgi:hypothetical protein